jgi:hypothetical protein
MAGSDDLFHSPKPATTPTAPRELNVRQWLGRTQSLRNQTSGALRPYSSWKTQRDGVKRSKSAPTLPRLTAPPVYAFKADRPQEVDRMSVLSSLSNPDSPSCMNRNTNASSSQTAAQAIKVENVTEPILTPGLFDGDKVKPEVLDQTVDAALKAALEGPAGNQKRLVEIVWNSDDDDDRGFSWSEDERRHQKQQRQGPPHWSPPPSSQNDCQMTDNGGDDELHALLEACSIVIPSPCPVTDARYVHGPTTAVPTLPPDPYSLLQEQFFEAAWRRAGELEPRDPTTGRSVLYALLEECTDGNKRRVSKCGLCNRMFSRADRAITHLRHKHLDHRPFRCGGACGTKGWCGAFVPLLDIPNVSCSQQRFHSQENLTPHLKHKRVSCPCWLVLTVQYAGATSETRRRSIVHTNVFVII